MTKSIGCLFLITICTWCLTYGLEAHNPFKNEKFFIDPKSNAHRQAELWRKERPDDAALMDILARQPQADWFGDWNKDIYQAVSARIEEITKTGSLPVFVAYNIPIRDLSSYSRGGAPTPSSYKSWIRAFAAGIGKNKAIVILEPDALAQSLHLDLNDRLQRYELLKDAIEVLTSYPHIAVYVDAGNSAWLTAEEAAGNLEKVCVKKAHGFALNVSNFQTNSDTIAYGKKIADRIGKPFIIDTSRNGKGPSPNGTVINPKGIGIGTLPTAETKTPDVDAFFWIKRIGESDGQAHGGPPAGHWWPEGALEILKNSMINSGTCEKNSLDCKLLCQLAV